MIDTDHRILRLALPSIVSNITVPLLGLCDVTIMGHVGGARHIGAIAVGSMIFNVIYWLFGFLRMGTSGQTAQAYGGRKMDEATALLRRTLFVALCLGLLFVLFQIPLRHLAFKLMQATPDVEQIAIPYYNICIWGAPAMLGLYVLAGWFIGMQNTRIPMFIAIAQNIVNMTLSLVLVLGFGLGVEGVALGTLIAQWTGFLASLLLLRVHYGKMMKRHRGSLSISHLSLFSVHFPLFLRTFCLVAVNLYFTSAGAAQGALVLAANTLLMQFFTFFSYVMDGFAYAGEALAGRYYGAGNYVMLRLTIQRLFRWGTAVAALFTLIYWLGGTAVLGLLTSDAEVVVTAGRYLPWAILIPVAGMAAFVWDGIYIGLTRSRGMLLSCFIASVVFFLLYFLFFPTMHNHALWMALIVYLALRGLVQTFLFIRQKANEEPVHCVTQGTMADGDGSKAGESLRYDGAQHATDGRGA